MASTELQVTKKRSVEIEVSDDVEEQMNDNREGNAQSAFTLTLPFVEEAPEVFAQTDLLKDSSEMLQHTNDSCPHIPVNSNDQETRLLDEVFQSKKVCQENICIVNMPQVSTIGETTLNFCASKAQKLNLKTEEAQNQNLEDVANTEKELLLKDLKLLHCPFTWNFNFRNTRKTSAEKIIAICDRKLALLEEEMEDGTNEFEWHKFVMTLTLCNEHYTCRNFSEALAKQQECERLIISCNSSEKSDMFFDNTKEALFHVVNACKCHIFVSLNMFSDAMKLMHAIPRYEDMKKNSIATIFAIQAAMLLEYGISGTKASLEYAKKAFTLDENEAEWNFLYGKILGRIRRVENWNGIPTEEELSVLEKAVTNSKKASHMVFLAQAYREAAFRTYVKNQGNLNLHQQTLNKMNKRSLQLYW